MRMNESAYGLIWEVTHLSPSNITVQFEMYRELLMFYNCMYDDC